jgi:hypothetical protein
MESQVFSPAAYALSPMDLIPPDDDRDADVAWLEYCRVASTLNRDDSLAVVLEDLDTPASPLYDLIDSALEEPYEPGRRLASIRVLADIGKAIMRLVAKAVDDQVALRMACAEKQPGQHAPFVLEVSHG